MSLKLKAVNSIRFIIIGTDSKESCKKEFFLAKLYEKLDKNFIFYSFVKKKWETFFSALVRCKFSKVHNSASIIASDCSWNKSTELNYVKLIKHTLSTVSAYQENNWKFLRVHPIWNWFHSGVLCSCMHICCCSYDKHDFNLSLEKYSEGIEFNEHSQVYGIVRIVILWIASSWDCL